MPTTLVRGRFCRATSLGLGAPIGELPFALGAKLLKLAFPICMVRLGRPFELDPIVTGVRRPMIIRTCPDLVRYAIGERPASTQAGGKS